MSRGTPGGSLYPSRCGFSRRASSAGEGWVASPTVAVFTSPLRT